jgi:hypothetical protein
MVRMGPARTSRAARDEAFLLCDHFACEAHDAEGEGEGEGEGRSQSAMLQRMTTQPWCPAGVCAAQGGRRDAAPRHHRQSAIHLQCHHRAHSASVSMTTKARGPRSRTTPGVNVRDQAVRRSRARRGTSDLDPCSPPESRRAAGRVHRGNRCSRGSSPAMSLGNRHRYRCQRQLRRSNVRRSD